MVRMHRLLQGGFTLIELLIVIMIIAILAGLIMGGLSLVKEKANVAATKSMINAIDTGARVFHEEQGYYPGADSPADVDDEESNVITLLVKTLRAKGLVDIKEQDLWVKEGDRFVSPTKDQRDDPEEVLYVIDAWGESYIARENESKQQKRSWMHNKEGMDIYSKGKNMQDDTALGTEGNDNDDLGNW